jgi:hypothetical protein
MLRRLAHLLLTEVCVDWPSSIGKWALFVTLDAVMTRAHPTVWRQRRRKGRRENERRAERSDRRVIHACMHVLYVCE